MTKKVYIKSFGWPLVQVPRNDSGDYKDGKWLGAKDLDYASHNFRN